MSEKGIIKYKNLLFFLARYFGYWMLFFTIARLLFLGYHHRLSFAESYKDLLLSLVHGLRMDASMSAYLCVLPFILSIFISKQWFNPVVKVYTVTILCLMSIAVIADLESFKSWKYRLEASIVDYLLNPGEAAASIQSSPLWLLTLFFVALVFLFYRIIPGITSGKTEQSRWMLGALSLFMTALLVVPMRGGLGIAPLNQGAVFFSNRNLPNFAAINAPWNFFHSWVHRKVKTNPFVAMEVAEAAKIVKELTNAGKHFDIIKHNRPNVILIIWESLTAKVMDVKHKKKSVLPTMEALRNQSVYFSNMYSSGDRTEKGLAATLSGYPAQPITSIVKDTRKAISLPVLSNDLSKAGYTTSFYYGGDLEFAGMQAYLKSANFHRMVSLEDFTSDQLNSKWGAHDEFVFQRWSEENKNMGDKPFFSVILTLSSHEPFEIPRKHYIEGGDDYSKYYNSLRYTDECLSEFLARSKIMPWWDNTLVIIVADHGHRLPDTGSRKDDFHTPMVWTGGAIDTVYVENKVVSQTDVAKSLLAQLGLEQTPYKWGKDIFTQKSNGWAYFAFNNGFGFVDQHGSVIYNNNTRIISDPQGKENARSLTHGKAFQQTTFEDYLKR
ncbi:MAG: sulfatase-like hydrolase/transferase [Saprospiraceae bacterium]|nr:sulfatase-like hydrolase/transferase [Saprospiraceae bacterium]